MKETKVSVRMSGWVPSDIVADPQFMEACKERVETALTEKKVFIHPWVKEIIVGKERETKE